MAAALARCEKHHGTRPVEPQLAQPLLSRGTPKRMRARVVLSWCAALALVVACGTRSPLKDNPDGGGAAGGMAGVGGGGGGVGGVGGGTVDGAVPSCVDGDLGSALGSAVATGSTRGRADRFAGFCGGDFSPDIALQWRAPQSGTFVFDTAGSSFDSVLSLYQSCGGRELICNDDAGNGLHSELETTLGAGESVIVVIDALDDGGSYLLNIREAGGAPSCPESDLGSAQGSAVAQGSTFGKPSQLSGTCGGFDFGEATFRWTAPRAGVFTFDTLGSSFDTVVYLRSGSCTGPELACNDDAEGGLHSRTAASLEAGQSIVVVVDGLQSGDFVLNVREIDARCPLEDLGNAAGISVSSDTALGVDLLAGTCGGSGGPEATYAWQAPLDGRYQFLASGFGMVDPVLYLLAGDCSGPELACNDDLAGLDSIVEVDLAAGQPIVIVTDTLGLPGPIGLTITLL